MLSTLHPPTHSSNTLGMFAIQGTAVAYTCFSTAPLDSLQPFPLPCLIAPPAACCLPTCPNMVLPGEEAETYIRNFGEREREPSLAESQAEIDKLHNAAETIRMTCTNDVRTGVYYIQCRQFKEMLASSAEALSRKLMDQVGIME